MFIVYVIALGVEIIALLDDSIYPASDFVFVFFCRCFWAMGINVSVDDINRDVNCKMKAER